MVANVIILQVSSFNLITIIMDCPFKLTFDYGVSELSSYLVKEICHRSLK